MDKVCAFLGNDYEHLATPKLIKERVKKEILKVIQAEDVDTFLVGEKGQYEKDAYDAVLEVREEHPELSFEILLVIAYMSELHPHHKKTKDIIEYEDDGRNTFGYERRAFDDYLYPPKAEFGYKRWGIVHRNNYIVDNANIIIAFNATQGRAFNFCQKARRKGVKIIELAEIYKDDLY